MKLSEEDLSKLNLIKDKRPSVVNTAYHKKWLHNYGRIDPRLWL